MQSILGIELVQEQMGETYLSLVDVIVFMVLGSLSTIFSILVLSTFMFMKKLRAQPGDIILCISLSELILSVHWITSALFSEWIFMDYKYPSGNDAFCILQGIISDFAAQCVFLYNICFNLYLFMAFRNILHASRIPKKTFHVTCLGLATFFTLVLLQTDGIGKTNFGTCSVKAKENFNYQSVIPTIAISIYILMSILILRYVKKHTPECIGEGKIKEEFLTFYNKYVISQVIVWSLIVATHIFLLYNTTHRDVFSKSSVRLVSVLGNIFKCASTFVLSILRFQDPILKHKLKKSLKSLKKKMCCCFNSRNQKSQDRTSSLTNSLIASGQDDKILFNRISDHYRLMLVKTTVSSIQQFYSDFYKENPQKFMKQQLNHSKTMPEYRSSNQGYNSNSSNINSNDVTRTTCIQISQHIIKEFQNEENSYENEQEQLLNVRLTAYNVNQFEKLMRSDGYGVDIFESLNLEKNLQAIKKAGSAEGGKGGEFFLFTHDSNLIIKTLTLEEKDLFLKIIDNYMEHYKRYPQSIISKIFGLFQIEFLGRDQKINIIIMRHLLHGINKSLVFKTFDLKGSKHQREVLTKNPLATVLKDIDFVKTEKNIRIHQSDQINLMLALERDVEFLRSQGIIDYSLLVIMVKLDSINNNIEQKSKIESFYKNPLFSGIKSCSSDSSVFYHIGIVDYFQLYNTQKMAEKYFKQIVQMSNDIETSSQAPNYYCNRFIEFIKSIVVN